jgi:hypothetical protein
MWKRIEGMMRSGEMGKKEEKEDWAELEKEVRNVEKNELNRASR